MGDGGVVLEVEVQKFDASGVVLGLQGAEGCGAPVWRAGAEEDVVGAFGEELAGEFEADAAVCCGLLVTMNCVLVWKRCLPPVTRTISFAKDAMILLLYG